MTVQFDSVIPPLDELDPFEADVELDALVEPEAVDAVEVVVIDAEVDDAVPAPPVPSPSSEQAPLPSARRPIEIEPSARDEARQRARRPVSMGSTLRRRRTGCPSVVRSSPLDTRAQRVRTAQRDLLGQAVSVGEGYAGLSFSITSNGSGNRPALCFENTSTPSASTSNCPGLPTTSSVCAPTCSRISAARPAALGL
jgi:hypothetical protein